MALYAVNSSEAVERIRNEQLFASKAKAGRTRTWCGRNGSPDWRSFGYLPDEYRAAVRAARYVVYSYDTPIAWVTQDGERVVPDIGYSLTTSEHQLAVKQAWNKTFTIPNRKRAVIPASDGPRHGGWPS